MLPPILAPDKIICVGINYPDRNAEYKDGRGRRKYPNLFCRFPASLVGPEQPIVRPKVSDKFDYEGEIVLVIGREGRHVPREQRALVIGGVTLGNEGSVRDWLRHGTLNVTQGKNFDRSGSLGPWIVTSDELDPGEAAASDHARQRRAAPGRHHRPADLGLRLADQLHLDLRDAQAGRPDLDRHADRRRRAQEPLRWAQARRRGGGGGAGDRRPAQQGGGRDVGARARAHRTLGVISRPFRAFVRACSFVATSPPITEPSHAARRRSQIRRRRLRRRRGAGGHPMVVMPFAGILLALDRERQRSLCISEAGDPWPPHPPPARLPELAYSWRKRRLAPSGAAGITRSPPISAAMGAPPVGTARATMPIPIRSGMLNMVRDALELTPRLAKYADAAAAGHDAGAATAWMHADPARRSVRGLDDLAVPGPAEPALRHRERRHRRRHGANRRRVSGASRSSTRRASIIRTTSAASAPTPTCCSPRKGSFRAYWHQER